MAINFPSNPTNAQEITEGNVTYVYNATKGYWESSEVSSGGASITVYADMTALIAATGMSDGDQAFVTANNNLYLYSGSGWYKIATVQNDSPSAITGVSGSYSLATDGTPTVITAVSTDPEGFPLTWSYSTSGLGSIATVSQVDNVFTITPSTDEANVGTFTLTLNVTDGVNGAVSANTSISLIFSITNSQYTTLLATAVDTTTNNVFTDSSTNNHTVTGYGNVYTGTFSPYRHGGYALNFNGSSHYLRADEIGDALGTGDFSISMWVYPHSMASGKTFFAANAISDGTNQFNVMTNEYIWNNVVTSLPTEWADNGVTVNTWSHIAVERDATNNTLQIWANGTRIAYETNLPAQDFSNDSWMFGAEADSANGGNLGNWFDGYMYDIKVSNTVVYGDNSSITVPTEISKTDANTVFRLSAGSLFDQSTSPISFTLNYDHFSYQPLDYTEIYSTANNGGSVYFDGSGDYLRADTALDGFTSTTDPWTMEAWVNPSRGAPTAGSTINDVVFGVNTAASGANIMLATTGTLNVGVDENYSVKAPNNAWSHFAVVYNGTVLKIYVNGQLAKTNTWTPSTALSACTFGIGTEFDAANGGSPGNFYQGYISDIRVLPTEHYTAEFIPPSAPLSSTGSVLHIQGTDASIIDKAQIHNLNLVGNTTGSTTQAKFANTKSMYFDGSGDYVSIASNPAFGFGTGDFTIEFWTYWGGTLNTGNGGAFVGLRSAVAAEALVVYLSTSGEIMFYDGPANVEVGSGVTITQEWTHIALTRESGLWRIFVNGTLGATRNSSTDLGSSKPCRIGQAVNGTTTSYHGYIQDLRVTKGLARYTANFTPPTEPLKG